MLTEFDERVPNANRAKEPYFPDKGRLVYPVVATEETCLNLFVTRI